jgi:hypothetical protein
MESGPFINSSYFYQKIFEFFSDGSVPTKDAIINSFSAFLIFIKPISLILSLFFLTGIIYCIIRIRIVLHEAEEKAHAKHHGASGGESPVHGKEHVSAYEDLDKQVVALTADKRWGKITEHLNSDNPSDWRLAILECDIILEEMLTKMSYRGETLSDKLKAVEKSDFLTIDKAWEAHRVRNAIAHEGSNFQLNDREAKRVVALYADVFKEFRYI